MGKVSIFLQGGILLFITSGCSSYQQVTCRTLFNEGDLTGSRSCCEEIYDERLKAFCLKQLDLAEEIQVCLRNASEKQQKGQLFEACELYEKVLASSNEMSWGSGEGAKLRAETTRALDTLLKAMLTRIEALYQTHRYREVGLTIEKYESVSGNEGPGPLAEYKDKAAAQIVFIEEGLDAVRKKLKKGNHSSAGKVLRKVRKIAPEYGAEVRELESRIRQQRKRAIGQQRKRAIAKRYERYKKSYAAGMRKHNYHEAVCAVEKAMKIARANARFGPDLPDLKAKHKKAAVYRAYALIVKRYEELMQADKGKYPLRVYRKALFEAKTALDLVKANPALAAETNAAAERVRQVRKKIEKSALESREPQVVGGQS